jgi:glycosyltransferase involved in cell wall biosynthesis
MRIAFVTPEFVTEEYFSGGLANYLNRFTAALTDLGHEVHVIVRSATRDETVDHGGVTVHRVRASLPKLWTRALVRLAPRDAERCLRFGIAAWRRLEEIHRLAPIDVVQLTNLQACGLFIAAFSRVPHVTRLSSLQRSWRKAAATERTMGVIVTEWLEILQLRLSRHLIAPSSTLATEVTSLAGVGTIEVVRSPAFVETGDVDDGLFRAHLAESSYLLFVGRLERHKGVQVLADALPSVLDAIPELEMVFVGRDASSEWGPSMAQHVRERCARFASRVHIFGETTHEQLYPIISGARLVVLPSLVDNLPNTLLEAMSLGRPVIGTLGTSFDEVIQDGRSGFLVPPGNAEALANKIREAWHHPDLAGIGRAARLAVEPFAPSETVAAALRNIERVRASRA